MAESSLKLIRRQIDRIDDKILALLAERAKLAKQIGAVKRLRGLPICHPEREKNLLARLRHKASKLGLSPHDAERVYKSIILMCRRLQVD